MSYHEIIRVTDSNYKSLSDDPQTLDAIERIMAEAETRGMMIFCLDLFSIKQLCIGVPRPESELHPDALPDFLPLDLKGSDLVSLLVTAMHFAIDSRTKLEESLRTVREQSARLAASRQYVNNTLSDELRRLRQQRVDLQDQGDNLREQVVINDSDLVEGSGGITIRELVQLTDEVVTELEPRVREIHGSIYSLAPLEFGIILYHRWNYLTLNTVPAEFRRYHRGRADFAFQLPEEKDALLALIAADEKVFPVRWEEFCKARELRKSKAEKAD